jgi:hypothetical protein
MEGEDRKKRDLWPVVTIIILLALLIGLGIKYRHMSLDINDMVSILNQKTELLSRMRIHLLKSVEAEKSAIMADTEGTSKALAKESQKEAAALEKDRAELGLLIKKDPSAQESKLLEEFDRCWKAFRKTDEAILEFAVKSTNLKAARLSFDKGGAAIKNLEEALHAINSEEPHDKTAVQADRLCCQALTAGLKVVYFQAPHIAASDEKEMDKIEKIIGQNEERMKTALEKLKALVPGYHQLSLQKAQAASEELIKVTAEVIRLSRQNTNIKSFEISLGLKRKETAQCDEILVSLQEAVRSRSFQATR